MEHNYKALDERDYRIILSFAKNSMREPETSWDLDVHRNTITYRIRKIKALTGLDPREFYDLIKLVDMAKSQLEGEADAE